MNTQPERRNAGLPKPPAIKVKIFEIGYGRTGTRSLARAIRLLGIAGMHWGAIHHPQMIEELLDGRLYSCVERYDYVSDFVAPLFREFDEAYPGSKFILTVREESAWLKSFTEHVTRRQLKPGMNFVTFYRMQKFGCFSFEHNPQRILQAYREHNQRVQEYFRDRTKDLLVFDVCAGDGWEKLCRFLGKPVPDQPFPHDKT
jgi:hypothetical protein